MMPSFKHWVSALPSGEPPGLSNHETLPSSSSRAPNSSARSAICGAGCSKRSALFP
ncbi:hypothetical protein IWW55_001888 [Coemansia sp. RSA 2706]|nr:hypothetical protein IWW55_001888 [Coemansia sp. RSA 2706]